jgi:hypothetical protein
LTRPNCAAQIRLPESKCSHTARTVCEHLLSGRRVTRTDCVRELAHLCCPNSSSGKQMLTQSVLVTTPKGLSLFGWCVCARAWCAVCVCVYVCVLCVSGLLVAKNLFAIIKYIINYNC